MGEYVWTTLTIGGKIKRGDLPKLVDVIKSCSGEDDSGVDEEFNPLGGTTVILQNHMNYGGIGKDNENTLKSLGLPFRIRFDAASGNFDAGIWQWTPENGKSAIEARENKPVACLQTLRRYAAKGKMLADVVAELSKFDAPLPPIEIVEDADWVPPSAPSGARGSDAKDCGAAS